jgi:hypothetical protein
VIGGVITSTLLTLAAVPVIFTYLDDLKHFLIRGAPQKSCHDFLTPLNANEATFRNARFIFYCIIPALTLNFSGQFPCARAAFYLQR